MLRTVASSGYLAATVEDVISRAGVSKRTFYENFDNKQDCLLAACDVVTEGWMREGTVAYQAALGNDGVEVRARLRAAMQAVFEQVERDPIGARAIFVEALNCGSAGVERLERGLRGLEDQLSAAFQLPSEHVPIPPPMIKVIVGGVLELITHRLRQDRTGELPGLIEDVTSWILCYSSAEAEAAVSRVRWPTPMSDAMAVDESARKESADDESPDVPFWTRRPVTIDPPRARALQETIRLVSRHGYTRLSMRAICEAARLSHNTFRKYFRSGEDAFLQAYLAAAQEVAAYSVAAFGAEQEWEAAVRAGLAAELRFLADRPDFARIGFLEVYAVGPKGLKLRDAELNAFTIALDTGHRDRAPHLDRIVSELIAGGLYYQWRAFLLRNPPENLYSLAPIATYTALAPFIGAQAATEFARNPPAIHQ